MRFRARTLGSPWAALIPAAALLWPACAPHGVRSAVRPAGPSIEERAAEAQQLVDRGCYACLEEALVIRRALHDAAPARVDLRNGVIELALLLALRDRQFAIPGDLHLAVATPLLEGCQDCASFEDMQATIRNTSSPAAGVVDDDTRVDFPRLDRDGIRPLARRLAAAAHDDPIAGAFYLELWSQFHWFDEDAFPPPDEVLADPGDSGLIAFSEAAVGSVEGAQRALELEPRGGEAHLALGLAEGQRAPGRAEQHLRVAFEALPRSIAAAHSLAVTLFALEDYPAALEQYERVLTLAPRHRDAQLRKGIVLHLLGQPRESVAALRKLLELGNWYLGEAHYWLALDERDLDAPADAERDAELAGRWLRGDPRVDSLRGDLALARDDVPAAEQLFTQAVAAAEALPSQWDGDDAVCDAHYSLGVIASRREAWPEGRTHFEGASHCRELAQQRVEERMARIRSWSVSEPRRRSLLEAKSRLLDRLRREDAGSLYNAAVCAFRDGQRLQARDLARRAGEAHETYAEKSQQLLWKVQ